MIREIAIKFNILDIRFQNIAIQKIQKATKFFLIMLFENIKNITLNYHIDVVKYQFDCETRNTNHYSIKKNINSIKQFVIKDNIDFNQNEF